MNRFTVRGTGSGRGLPLGIRDSLEGAVELAAEFKAADVKVVAIEESLDTYGHHVTVAWYTPRGNLKRRAGS
jgi:hypothetical protein